MDTLTQPADPLVGRLLDGRYRLDGVIDRGGMATVYTGEDTRLERPVAVKVMHRALADDPVFVDRFAQEARAAARLSVPEVVAVHDQGRDPATGLAYLVMEHVRGRNLRQLLRARGPLPPGRALGILEPVLRALAAAHSAGLVHRDVKPENVLLADDGRVKVADFGLARAVESSTVTGPILLGTPAYLAPEQVSGLPATERSDVYAAGVLLFEMLTGAPPYTDDSHAALVARHVSEDVPPPGAVVEGVPAELDRLAVRATRRDPAERPRDAGALLAELLPLRLALPDEDDATQVVRRSPDARTVAVPVARAVPPQPTPVPPAALRTPPPPRRPRRGVLLLVVLALLTLAAVAGGWYLGSGRYTSAPAVLGMNQAQAQQRLTGAGLRVRMEPARFDESVAAGHVLAQQPAPRGKVRRDGTVSLVLSKGPDRRAVPRLAGSTEAAARQALSDVGLRVGKTTRSYSSSVPEGSVIKSSPDAGGRLRPDSSVALVLSKGVELLPVPGVQGQPQDAAAATLKDAGFAADVTTAYDDTVPAGDVVSQSPAQGSAPRSSTVRLVVSSGPELVTVPDLGGSDHDQAAQQLAALGLEDRAVGLPFGGVHNQNPAPGTQVRKGSVVTLVFF